MDPKLENLRKFALELETRPKGYIGPPWTGVCWNRVTDEMKLRSETWGLIAGIWASTRDLLALDPTVTLNTADTQELSEQFYALYTDMVWEVLRTYGVSRGSET